MSLNSSSFFSGEILVSGLHEALVSAPVRLHVHVLPGSIYQLTKSGLERTISLVGVEVSLLSTNDFSVSVLGAPGLSKVLVLTPCGETSEKMRLFEAIKSAALLSPSLSGLCQTVVGGMSKVKETDYKYTAILLSSNKQRLVLCLKQSIERLGQFINIAEADNTIVMAREKTTNSSLLSEEEKNEYQGAAAGASLITALAQNSVLGRRADNCDARRLRSTSKRRALLASELLYQEEQKSISSDDKERKKLDAYRARVVAAAINKMSIVLERCVWMNFSSSGYTEGSNSVLGTSIPNALFSSPSTLYFKIREGSIMGSGYGEGGGCHLLRLRQMFRSKVSKTQSFWLNSVSIQPCVAEGGKPLKADKEGSNEEALSSSTLFSSGLVGARLGRSELSRAFRNVRKYVAGEWIDYVMTSIRRCQEAVRQWLKKRKGVNQPYIATALSIETSAITITNETSSPMSMTVSPASASVLSPSRSDRIAALKGL